MGPCLRLLQDWFGYFKFIWTHLQCDNDHCSRTVKQFGNDTYETGIALSSKADDPDQRTTRPLDGVHTGDYCPNAIKDATKETIKNPNNKAEITFEKELDTVAVL